jgi:hypothetical protein
MKTVRMAIRTCRRDGLGNLVRVRPSGFGQIRNVNRHGNRDRKSLRHYFAVLNRWAGQLQRYLNESVWRYKGSGGYERLPQAAQPIEHLQGSREMGYRYGRINHSSPRSSEEVAALRDRDVIPFGVFFLYPHVGCLLDSGDPYILWSGAPEIRINDRYGAGCVATAC